MSLVKGHALLHEGAAHNDLGLRVVYGDRTTGRAQCECGETSAVVTSTAARKRWHRDHKALLTPREGSTA